MKNILTLPEELLVSIFLFLDVKSLIRTRSLCKQFSGLIDGNQDIGKSIMRAKKSKEQANYFYQQAIMLEDINKKLKYFKRAHEHIVFSQNKINLEESKIGFWKAQKKSNNRESQRHLTCSIL